MREAPGRHTQLGVAFATLVLVALGAFTLGAVLDSAAYMFVVLALATPIVILVLMRRAGRRKETS